MRTSLKLSVFAGVLGGLACLVGCHKSTEFQFHSQSGQRLAKVGNLVLTVEGLNDELKNNPGFWQQKLMSSPENKKQFVETQVRTELMAQEAIRLGYLEKPEVQKEIKRLLVQRVIKDKIGDLAGNLKITEDEAQKYYDEHSEEFNFPERMRLGYFRVPKGTSEGSAKAKAQASLKLVLALKPGALSKDFDAIVQANDLAEPADPKNPNSPKKPAILGSMDRNGLTELLGPKVTDATFALTKDGEVTNLIETDDAYCVVKRYSHFPAVTRDFPTAKPSIEQNLISQKRTEIFSAYVETLKKDLGVTIDETRLAMIGVGDESKKVIESATAEATNGDGNAPKAIPPTKVMVQASHSTADAKPQIPEPKRN